MGDPARQRDPRTEQGDGKVPTISLSELRENVKRQPYHEQLFTWAGIIYAGASILPWSEVDNGWSSSGLFLISSTVVIGLVIHLLGLLDIGPGGRLGFWKIYRWVACVQLALFLIYVLIHLPAIGSWEIGLVLACLSLPTMMVALYKILEQRSLLPFRITK